MMCWLVFGGLKKKKKILICFFKVNELKIEIEPEVFPAGTDSRFIRALGVCCFEKKS